MSDYISREELSDNLCYGISCNECSFNTTSDGQSGCLLQERIDNLASADVRENIHGEWLRMSDLPEDKDDRYKCSNCGTVVHYSNGVNLYHFNSWCGRCGSLNNSLIADMRGE